MSTSWEPFGRSISLLGHRIASGVMRLRYLGKPKQIDGYGSAAFARNKVMLKLLAGPMDRFTLVSIRRLDPDDLEHGTWNLVFEGRGKPEFCPGDMAYLCWRNNPDVVRGFLDMYGIDGTQQIATTVYSSKYMPARFEKMTLKEALESRVDLQECSEQTLRSAGLNSYIKHNRIQDKLHRQFHKDTDKEGGLVVTHPHFDYRHVHLPSVISSLNGKRPSLKELVRRQGRIHPRPYTMSGFEQISEDRFRFEITVSQVEKTLYKANGETFTHPARGATFLTGLKTGDMVEGWLLPEFHKFPSTIGRDVPVIVVCTGSGVGGLLSLLKSKADSGPIWLIYGVRSWKKKHLYGPELENFVREKKIARLDPAVSRPAEGEGKAQRVQDFIWDNRVEIAEQLRKGAHIYLSGRFSMGTGVVQTLEKILVDQGLEPDQPSARKTLISWNLSLRLQASVSGV